MDGLLDEGDHEAHEEHEAQGLAREDAPLQVSE